jgi:hypothetical protein
MDSPASALMVMGSTFVTVRQYCICAQAPIEGCRSAFAYCAEREGN